MASEEAAAGQAGCRGRHCAVSRIALLADVEAGGRADVDRLTPDGVHTGLSRSEEVRYGSGSAPKGRGAVSMCGSAARLCRYAAPPRGTSHDGAAVGQRRMAPLPAERLGSF
ncbi:hypothetical protein SVIO_036220 [Streptomyces violaceusniger]|uniref:Uncharacterized protein n=1 Tax=Streptomyces violaceusniger TaxID=68280 RepID=A0A4D4L4N6_STRVO|nr:hypothetical protein SVIO_036220 [Streptomyces violaceusniger]